MISLKRRSNKVNVVHLYNGVKKKEKEKRHHPGKWIMKLDKIILSEIFQTQREIWLCSHLDLDMDISC